MTTRTWRAAARFGMSCAVLWIVFRFVDPAEVLTRLAALDLAWVALGLAISVPQVAVLAWRWRFTAARLGIDLPLRTAVSEYYLGIFLNQVLPGGVAGDVSRAWRHARAQAPVGPAVRAVVLERASAQVVMTLTALASLLALSWAPTWTRAGAAALGIFTTGLLIHWLSRPGGSTADSVLGRLRADARQALVAKGALAPQLVSAGLVVASYIGVFLIAGRAVGVETPLGTVLPMVAPVLMTMLVPVSVAGWGLREAGAVALWSLAGLTAEEGAATSVAYGLLVLASASPGLVVLMRTLIAGRSRRERPPRG